MPEAAQVETGAWGSLSSSFQSQHSILNGFTVPRSQVPRVVSPP